MPDKTWVSEVVMRCDPDNLGTVKWSDSGHEAGGYLLAEEAVTIEFDGQTLAGTFFIVGAAGEIVYMSIGVNSQYFDHMGLS
jgi:hypothetical protein